MEVVMEVKKLLEYIETTASKILMEEYGDPEACLAIEAINFNFLESYDPFYTIIIRYRIKDTQASFEVPSVAGLNANLFDFTSEEAFALTIFISNLAIKLRDMGTISDAEELLAEEFNTDPSTYC
jgi:hypothetical protein